MREPRDLLHDLKIVAFDHRMADLPKQIVPISTWFRRDPKGLHVDVSRILDMNTNRVQRVFIFSRSAV